MMAPLSHGHNGPGVGKGGGGEGLHAVAGEAQHLERRDRLNE